MARDWLGQRTNDDREGGRPENLTERIPVKNPEDDFVYCERHLRMVRRSEGCPACLEELAKLDF